MAAKKVTKKSYAQGRNRYAQKCVCCGHMVPAMAGFLKKRPKGFTGYEVYHELCKPGPVTEKLVSKESEILSILEAKLVQRKLDGAPIEMLPKIIDHIKDLEVRVEKLNEQLSFWAEKMKYA